MAKGWPDEKTRRLLEQRSLDDENEYTRSAALQALAEGWPDDATRRFLQKLAVHKSVDTRGSAGYALGSEHSRFGKIVFSKDLDGVAPYLDPRAPIPRDHIEKAAQRAGISPDRVDEQIASLSAFLGWDITIGAGEGGGKPEDG